MVTIYISDDLSLFSQMKHNTITYYYIAHATGSFVFKAGDKDRTKTVTKKPMYIRDSNTLHIKDPTLATDYRKCPFNNDKNKPVYKVKEINEIRIEYIQDRFNSKTISKTDLVDQLLPYLL